MHEQRRGDKVNMCGIETSKQNQKNKKKLTLSNSTKSSSSVDPLAPPIFSLINCHIRWKSNSQGLWGERDTLWCLSKRRVKASSFIIPFLTWFALLICFLNPAKDMVSLMRSLFLLIVKLKVNFFRNQAQQHENSTELTTATSNVLF